MQDGPSPGFVVGITGHRDVSAANVDLVKTIEKVLAGLRDQAGSKPVTLLSCLAEGADRLVARLAADTIGASLVAPLPFAPEEYEKDFASAQSRREFYDLLGEAQLWFVVDDDGGRDGDRSCSYACVGAWLVAHCDVLIAVWDGKPPRGDGGTGQLVEWVVKGQVPSRWRACAGNDAGLARRVLAIDPRGGEVRVLEPRRRERREEEPSKGVRAQPVLALDFDGVICASGKEVFLTGLETYALLEPSARIAAGIVRITDLVRRSPAALADDPLFQAFQPMVPLGNRAEDFGVGLAALDRGLELEDQGAYDVFYRGFDPDWLRRYHQAFYETRHRLRKQDLDLWLSLHEPYEWFCDLLRHRRHDATLAIATAKDARSVGLLLERFGIADLFAQNLVLDKETGVHKTEHLRLLAERLDAPLGAITFVDDKVNHLEKVAPLGVRPVLAGWGYNTAREHARAETMSFEVAMQETAEEILLTSAQYECSIEIR